VTDIKGFIASFCSQFYVLDSGKISSLEKCEKGLVESWTVGTKGMLLEEMLAISARIWAVQGLTRHTGGQWHDGNELAVFAGYLIG